jgi:hypothetical protein
MAVGRFMTYLSAVRYMAEGLLDLDTAQVNAMPLHSGYGPGTASHSALSQIANFQASAGGVAVAIRALAAQTVTQSGNVAVKFTSSNISGFSAGGSVFNVKYIALFASASAGNTNNPLVGFYDTDTASTTGISSVQLNVNVPAGGWFKIDTNV